MSIESISNEDLLKEMERRKLRIAEDLIPKLKEDPDLVPLKRLAEEIKAEEFREENQYYSNEDNKNWCYEAIMKAFYGENYFDAHEKYFNVLNKK